METKETHTPEEEAMDRILYIIRDHLPKEAVDDLHKYIGKIKCVKSITDMKAYLVLEFYTKIDADAAKAKGFEYTLNGQNQKIDFATSGLVSVYMMSACKTIGTGY